MSGMGSSIRLYQHQRFGRYYHIGNSRYTWFIDVDCLHEVKTLDKVALTEDVASTVDRTIAANVQVGDKGYAITRLALIGNADINGHVVEVRSSSGFLNEKTPVEVIRVSDNEIIVQEIINS